MNGLGNVRIKGISGKEYKFRAYPMDTKFIHLGAVYFITSRNLNPDGRISHSRIYCGETNDLSTYFDDNKNVSCFKAHFANCICILPQEDEQSRLNIENDVHNNYKLLCNI
ncbi:MAG: hypothetical protein HY964_05950 [Ignavibacteriales bacterium]|nr:hypothetical protein [Ignavibacteriales bacterium]